MSAVTQWFRMSDKPALPGVYQILVNDTRIWHSKWTGEVWGATCSQIDGAASEIFKSRDCYSGRIVAWRGLAVKP